MSKLGYKLETTRVFGLVAQGVQECVHIYAMSICVRDIVKARLVVEYALL